mgnify:FL=1
MQPSTVNPWGGPLIRYNTNTILEIKKGYKSVANALNTSKEFVHRVQRKRYISTVEAPDVWVWCKENYGYTEIPRDIYEKIPQIVKGKVEKEEDEN